MIGWQFGKYVPSGNEDDPFKKLLNIFKDLLVYTSGDVAEALSWLTELDKQYNLTDENYGIADFIQDLIDRGYIADNNQNGGGMGPTAKMEIELRKKGFRRHF